ncbi:hypothetical protein AMTRI_Chr09g35930 [Amborella trichopoda]
MDEDLQQDIVIVGAGIAGLATALGLHRQGLKSLILESHDALRTAGFALTVWTNAWKVLEALGVADTLRQQHVKIQRSSITSLVVGSTSYVPFTGHGNCGEFETRCVRRDLLMEALVREMPNGSIKFGAKVVNIEEKHNESPLYLIHLADGTIIKAKVLIGCDGVNSVVTKWLGFEKPAFVRRSASRGLAEYPGGHNYKPDFLQYFGDGFRMGFLPCNDKSMYWFFTWSPTQQEKGNEDDPMKMKQLILEKMEGVPEEVRQVIEKTEFQHVITSPLRCTWPWRLLRGNICKGNVCVAGDAFHSMTPDVGQGGCTALEDGLVLARCLGEAILSGDEGKEHKKIQNALKKYAEERRWRAIKIITFAFVFGTIQQSRGRIMNFVRDRLLAKMMQRKLLAISDFDCGKLSAP